MTVQHIGEKGSHSNKNSSNIHNCSLKKKKGSKEVLNTKPIYELSETVTDKAWKLELGLSSALASTAKYSGILSIHKLSRGEKKGKEKSVIAHCLTEEFKERLEKVSVSHGKAETQKTEDRLGRFVANLPLGNTILNEASKLKSHEDVGDGLKSDT